MGKPVLPNEYLYMCYTDQTTKCNPNVVPTSIIFKNKNDANAVLGIYPNTVDFDVKSSVYKNGSVNFVPKKQVKITW